MAYTNNKNQQILQALLKEHGVKKIIASPGGTNPAMVMSFQLDPDFEMYSSVDERSAAYMACGLAEECNEPVAICCTGATASRNYMPALTEAYYRKLPIVVITCSRPNYYIGHLFPQVTNRSVYPADIIVDGEQLQTIKDANDAWEVEYKVNKALLELSHHGGGPVHFNVECSSQACTTEELPKVHMIRRVTQNDAFPALDAKRIAIFVGAHKQMSNELVSLIDRFCECNNGVVFSDHTSGYNGKYSIPFALIGTQQKHRFGLATFDLLIHLGEQSGDYLTMESIHPKRVWRISEDGEVRIRFRTLDYVFEMPDFAFWKNYITKNKINIEFFNKCAETYNTLLESIPQLPFCHMYIAKELAPKMPSNCVIHFAIINALRSWNFFRLSPTIRTNCNVGGFGIDGCTSTLIGASLADPTKNYFLFTGDLAFFYDLNSLGNRHIGNNVRILLLNDGLGAEFTNYRSVQYDGDRKSYIAAAGHYGNQSEKLVRDYAEDLGFEYLQAKNKEEFDKQYCYFIDAKIKSKPILFEVFANDQGQSASWKILSELADGNIEDVARQFASKNINKLKKILGK